jgi:hypothetical protein
MKVILVEFNELTPSLMTRFIGEGALPNFARFFRESQSFITDAEEEGGNLEPWIQWVTVHSGLPFTRGHGVFHLGQGHDLASPSIWDLASEQGRKVWVCGSMNAYARGKMNGHFLPDPWAAQAGPQPDDLAPFFRFVQAGVQEHARSAAAPLGPGDYLRFLAFMARHGLSASTLMVAARQFLSGDFRENPWKRAVILDRLQFDLFRHVYRRERPDLATFFSNSTAHFQHRFWRHMQPEVYRHKPKEEELRKFGPAILYGYRQMDWMLGEFLKLAGPDTAVIMCTALSQQPCLVLEDLGGGVCYRPRDIDSLMRFAGITLPYAFEQAMASRSAVRFRSQADAREAARRLDALRVGDQKALHQVDVREEVVFLDCGFHDGPLEDLPLRADADAEASVRFGDMFYPYGNFNGMHHPDGMFWVRLPGKTGQAHPGKISLTSVAPTLLSLLGLPVPAGMPGAAVRF